MTVVLTWALMPWIGLLLVVLLGLSFYLMWGIDTEVAHHTFNVVSVLLIVWLITILIRGLFFTC